MGRALRSIRYKERLTKEIKEQVAESVDVKSIAPPEGVDPVWIGGAIFASLKTFQETWVTRREYKEMGPQIIRRCF